MNTSSVYLFISSVLLGLAALPLVNSYHWFIRALDFPRAQLLLIELLFFIFIITAVIPSQNKSISIVMILVAMMIDVYRVGPYFPFYPTESTKAALNSKDEKIKVLSYNVFIGNKKFNKARELIKKNSPDIVVLLETDQEWADALEDVKNDYEFSKFIPQENTYGIILFSKFEIEKIHVEFLTDDKVPSIFADLKVKEQKIKLVVLHPRPPRPKEGTSLQRDGELAKAALRLKDLDGWPIMVVGDFNDVAWSHTSRLFKSVAGLLDPRIGRGFFNTFHTKYPFIQIPLDHIFHNEHFEVQELVVMEDAGSDHYPIFGVFSLKAQIEKSDEPEKPSEENMEEIKKTEQDSKDWKGPKEEDSEESEKQ